LKNTSYYLDVGEFQCIIVSDGNISVPKLPSAQSQTGNEKPTYEDMDISCIVIKAGKRNLLIDTGCGDGFQESAGKLVSNLKQEGINPEDIDTVIYTHGHEDHSGGTFDLDGNPIFPNAKYIVIREEWKCWERKPETPLNEGLFSSARKNLLPIQEKFKIVENNYEIIPGIKLILAPGHTLGSVIVQIKSGEDGLLCIGDLIHSSIEFSQPDYYSFLDSDPEKALKLRTEGLSQMAQSRTLIFACHFPFPGIGYFIEENDMLTWQPVNG
jgi:glyoxylase-like metal-dependent hydrolase (beta-lactamase superfamily II)